ncbi:MAG: serine hydrolase domain-containing protein, partial [Nocardioides sp.]
MSTQESPATRVRLRGATVALLLGALLLAACSGSADRHEAEIDPDRLTEQINGYLGSVASFDAVRVVLVQSDGEAVVDLYRGADPEDYWDVESVTKSVTSILVGIAVDQGHIAGTDQTLAQLLPSYAAQMAPQVAEVTLHQLLTMTAGFSGVFDRSGFIDRTAQEMRAADPVGRILRTASASRAGEFDYSNGGAHLVSAILAEATGMSVLDYARSHLFEPLGISSEPAHEPVGGGLGVDEPPDPLWGMSAGYARAYLEADFAWPVDNAGNHLG